MKWPRKGEKVLEGGKRKEDIAGKENHEANAETEENRLQSMGLILKKEVQSASEGYISHTLLPLALADKRSLHKHSES